MNAFDFGDARGECGAFPEAPIAAPRVNNERRPRGVQSIQRSGAPRVEIGNVLRRVDISPVMTRSRDFRFRRLLTVSRRAVPDSGIEMEISAGSDSHGEVYFVGCPDPRCVPLVF